ncbi:MAG TPA: hypothetical protein VFQ22_05720 [Longimicrobiales bacterium]|nr:hypothetical protein [Longimicrobiales bacterium]
MKRIVMAVLGLLAFAGTARAQTDAELIERALSAAPERFRADAMVVKWNADHTYTVIKEGSNNWVCYDHSGAVGEQPFAVQCTHPGNLDRVAQNFRLEAQANGDREELQRLLAAAEADGTRVKPVYGSVFISRNGPDAASARTHMTIAVPGATEASTGLPESGRAGAAWIMNAGTSTAHIMVPGS